MKVRFGEIPEEGLRYEINDEAWFPDHELQRIGPVRSVVTLRRNGLDRVLLEGLIQTTVAFDCDRCTENFNLEINSDFKLDLEYVQDSKLAAPAEHQCSSLEMDVVFLQEPVVDVFEILGQQVFLMIPGKHLCIDSCRGLCPGCGVNLNNDNCVCKKDLASSPFAVLKK